MSFFVVKRDGKRESVHFDKITSRIEKLMGGLNRKVSARTTTSSSTTNADYFFDPSQGVEDGLDACMLAI